MKQAIHISNRLKEIARYLSNGTYFLDIGSDHAHLPVYVCLKDPSAKVIAGEVNKGPFEHARHTVNQYHLKNRIDVRLGDGLQVIRSEDHVFELVIAGMGGTLIKQILDTGNLEDTNITRIITQPNIDERDARLGLICAGYTITEEKIIEENNHIYEIIVADYEPTKSSMPWSDKELFFGKHLLTKRDALFQKKWEDQLLAHDRIIQQMKRAKNIEQGKLTNFIKERRWIEEVLIDGNTNMED